MRARIVFTDSVHTEKPVDVVSVTEAPDSIIVETETYTLTYEKARVAYFQIVWHPDGD